MSIVNIDSKVVFVKCKVRMYVRTSWLPYEQLSALRKSILIIRIGYATADWPPDVESVSAGKDNAGAA